MSDFIQHIRKILCKDVWLISERGYDAEDNGYVFFSYLRKKHPEVMSFFLIDHSHPAMHRRVAKIGKTVCPNSLNHILIYLCATRIVSSQLFFDVPEIVLNNKKLFALFNRKKKTCFLQHGVIKDDINYFYNIKKVQERGYNLDLFICSAQRECDYVASCFGYPNDVVKNIGLARFDLYHRATTKRQILIMPTWRKYFEKYTVTNKNIGIELFKREDYYKRYQSLLNNGEIDKLLERYNYSLVFYPHNNVQEYRLNIFSSQSKHMRIADKMNSSVQKLLRDSALLITDMSSVFMDFAYMERPVIYYHFDYCEYRKGHFKEGYFNYEQDGFGDIVCAETDLIHKVEYYLKNECINEEKYIKRSRDFFGNKKISHCAETYKEIIK